MIHILDSLLPSMMHVHMLGYWIALLFAFSETVIGVGLFIPGSSALLLMGAMAAGGSFDIGDLIFFAVCGAIIGDNINYIIGKKLGSSVSTKGFWFIRPNHIQKAYAFFERHGSKSVFLGRFVPSMKEIVPFIAGSLRMRRARFMVWNILGGIGWSLVWILPGYFFATSLNTAAEWISRTGFLLLYVVAFLVLGALIKWFIVRKGQAIFLLFRSLWASFKQSFSENKELIAYTKKHPRVFSWIAKRLNPHSVLGRPATFLFLIFVYVSFLFGGVIESLIKSEVITSVDIRVSHLLLLFRDNESVQIFWWITVLGKAHMVLVVICAVSAILWVLKKRIYLIPFWVTVFGSI
ncbi:PA-phosphatase, partial [Candidatus Roizmanbacteria bacterium CG_4_10_14_3_um_filter_39_13]